MPIQIKAVSEEYKFTNDQPVWVRTKRWGIVKGYIDFSYYPTEQPQGELMYHYKYNEPFPQIGIMTPEGGVHMNADDLLEGKVWTYDGDDPFTHEEHNELVAQQERDARERWEDEFYDVTEAGMTINKHPAHCGALWLQRDGDTAATVTHVNTDDPHYAYVYEVTASKEELDIIERFCRLLSPQGE